MRFSIVICTWNRCATLAQSLHSLSYVRVPAGSLVETIVVDNNSSDATRQTIEQLQPDWPLGQLRYLFEGRQGKQFALNTAIEHSSGEVLALTDDDIVFPRDWLEAAVAVFSEPGVELAGGRTLIVWPPEGPPDWYQNDMLAVLGGVDLGKQRLDPAPSHYAPGGGNMFVRRGLFDRVGRFDERLYRHMDHEFGTRSQATGTRVVYDPRLTVHAPVDTACLTERYFRRWSFKAGFARSGGAAAVEQRWPQVPLWVYRQLAEDWVFSRFGSRRAAELSHRFARELRMWRAWGTVANAWHAFAFPKSHAQWVQDHSQKKSNLY